MTLFITVNAKHLCNVVFINVISYIVISKVFISITVLKMD
jgi:hypothetical protein